MDNSFNKIRTMMQGILLLVVSLIGWLGLYAFAVEQRDLLMSLMFGVVSPLATALGAWLIWRSRRM